MRSSERRIAATLAVMALGLAACTPEARRERATGPGADIGNHGWPVQMHGDTDPVRRVYHETPRMGRGIERTGSAGAIQPGA